MRPLIPLLLTLLLSDGDCESELLRSKHVTSHAAKPSNDLWCFRCLAEMPDDKCAKLSENDTDVDMDYLHHKCSNDRRLCMVKRFSYTTSTENSTTALKMWAIERNCTKHCEPGCIVIGERTKLYACTSCCSKRLCNIGSSAIALTETFGIIVTMLFINLRLFL